MRIDIWQQNPPLGTDRKRELMLPYGKGAGYFAILRLFCCYGKADKTAMGSDKFTK